MAKTKTTSGSLSTSETQILILRDYLAVRFPEALVTNGTVHGFETTVTKTIELLNKLLGYEQKAKEDAQYLQKKLDESHANAVKGAVARLIGGYGKQLSTDDLKKQCAQMLGDDKFWRDLSTLAWSQEEMKKLLGPYAY